MRKISSIDEAFQLSRQRGVAQRMTWNGWLPGTIADTLHPGETGPDREQVHAWPMAC